MAKRKLTAAEEARMNRELDAVYEVLPSVAQCKINQILHRWGRIDECRGNPKCRACPSR